jgi:membrane fusion protein, multidrug efflux system
MYSYNNIRQHCFFIFLLFSLGFTSCDTGRSEEQTSETTLPVVRAQHPEERFYQRVLQYSATIKPWREANLGSSLPGRVEKIYFSEGSFVQQGALIAELGAEPALLAEVEKNTLENEYNRVLRLLERGSITRQEYEHVEAKYQAAKTKHDLMKKNTEIRAPFAGHIMEILVREGETFFFVPALQPGISFSPGIVRLMQLNPIKAEFHISEKELSLFRSASEITIEADALPGEVFRAELHKTGTMVSPTNQTIAMEVQIGNPDQMLMVGMQVKISVKLHGDTHVFIPSQSLVEENGQYFVWILDELQKPIQKPVDRLFMQGSDTAIKGLQISDRLIVSGFSGLKEGMDVALIQ